MSKPPIKLLAIVVAGTVLLNVSAAPLPAIAAGSPRIQRTVSPFLKQAFALRAASSCRPFLKPHILFSIAVTAVSLYAMTHRPETLGTLPLLLAGQLVPPFSAPNPIGRVLKWQLPKAAEVDVRAVLNRIQETMASEGMDDGEVAANIKSHRVTVSTWFSNGRLPEPTLLVPLRRVLGQSVSYFLVGIDGNSDLAEEEEWAEYIDIIAESRPANIAARIRRILAREDISPEAFKSYVGYMGKADDLLEGQAWMPVLSWPRVAFFLYMYEKEAGKGAEDEDDDLDDEAPAPALGRPRRQERQKSTPVVVANRVPLEPLSELEERYFQIDQFARDVQRYLRSLEHDEITYDILGCYKVDAAFMEATGIGDSTIQILTNRAISQSIQNKIAERWRGDGVVMFYADKYGGQKDMLDAASKQPEQHVLPVGIPGVSYEVSTSIFRKPKAKKKAEGPITRTAIDKATARLMRIGVALDLPEDALKDYVEWIERWRRSFGIDLTAPVEPEERPTPAKPVAQPVKVTIPQLPAPYRAFNAAVETHLNGLPSVNGVTFERKIWRDGSLAVIVRFRDANRNGLGYAVLSMAKDQSYAIRWSNSGKVPLPPVVPQFAKSVYMAAKDKNVPIGIPASIPWSDRDFAALDQFMAEGHAREQALIKAAEAKAKVPTAAPARAAAPVDRRPTTALPPASPPRNVPPKTDAPRESDHMMFMQTINEFVANSPTSGRVRFWIKEWPNRRLTVIVRVLDADNKPQAYAVLTPAAGGGYIEVRGQPDSDYKWPDRVSQYFQSVGVMSRKYDIPIESRKDKMVVRIFEQLNAYPASAFYLTRRPVVGEAQAFRESLGVYPEVNPIFMGTVISFCGAGEGEHLFTSNRFWKAAEERQIRLPRDYTHEKAAIIGGLLETIHNKAKGVAPLAVMTLTDLRRLLEYLRVPQSGLTTAGKGKGQSGFTLLPVLLIVALGSLFLLQLSHGALMPSGGDVPLSLAFAFAAAVIVPGGGFRKDILEALAKIPPPGTIHVTTRDQPDDKVAVLIEVRNSDGAPQGFMLLLPTPEGYQLISSQVPKTFWPREVLQFLRDFQAARKAHQVTIVVPPAEVWNPEAFDALATRLPPEFVLTPPTAESAKAAEIPKPPKAPKVPEVLSKGLVHAMPHDVLLRIIAEYPESQRGVMTMLVQWYLHLQKMASKKDKYSDWLRNRLFHPRTWKLIPGASIRVDGEPAELDSKVVAQKSFEIVEPDGLPVPPVFLTPIEAARKDPDRTLDFDAFARGYLRLLQLNPIDNWSVSDICRQSGYEPGELHRYFLATGIGEREFRSYVREHAAEFQTPGKEPGKLDVSLIRTVMRVLETGGPEKELLLRVGLAAKARGPGYQWGDVSRDVGLKSSELLPRLGRMKVEHVELRAWIDNNPPELKLPDGPNAPEPPAPSKSEEVRKKYADLKGQATAAKSNSDLEKIMEELLKVDEEAKTVGEDFSANSREVSEAIGLSEGEFKKAEHAAELARTADRLEARFGDQVFKGAAKIIQRRTIAHHWSYAQAEGLAAQIAGKPFGKQMLEATTAEPPPISSDERRAS